MNITAYLFLIILQLQTAFPAPSKIVWTTHTTHDFGKIPKGNEVNHVFTFKNMSAQPVTLDNVRTDCGCTATDWDATPVLPNQTGKITVNYDAAKLGFFQKKIIVWVHGQRKSERLTILGEVE
jgi:hypothetical protein